MEGVPAGVDAGHLVGEELDAVHEAGRAQDERVGDDGELCGEGDVARQLQEAQGGDCRVEINPRRPAHTHRQRDCLDCPHATTSLAIRALRRERLLSIRALPKH